MIEKLNFYKHLKYSGIVDKMKNILRFTQHVFKTSKVLVKNVFIRKMRKMYIEKVVYKIKDILKESEKFNDLLEIFQKREFHQKI